MGAQESSRRITVDNNSGDDTIGVVLKGINNIPIFITKILQFCSLYFNTGTEDSAMFILN